jgi:transposase
MSNFVTVDRKTDYLFPPSVSDWLPKNHLARLVVEIGRGTYDSIAFRYLAANTHPDHDTIASFRRRFLPQFEALFVQVLLLAREMKLMKLGHIALDGTKVKANASKHKALSYAHLLKT